MGLRYSPSTGGFYDPTVHQEIPNDSVSVSRSRHAELMDAQANGRSIVPSLETGGPTIGRSPGSKANERRADLIAAIRREAARRIDLVSPQWRQLNDLRRSSPAGEARFARIDEIRVASNRIEGSIGDLADDEIMSFSVRDHPSWPASTQVDC